MTFRWLLRLLPVCVALVAAAVGSLPAQDAPATPPPPAASSEPTHAAVPSEAPEAPRAPQAERAPAAPGLASLPAAPVEQATPPATAPLPAAPVLSAAPVKVVIIPVRDEIADPILYVIRRGLKEAIDQGAKTVILDMQTPGGSLGTTLEIMQALDRFEGRTITFVNDEATSAGAIIAAVTDEIYFAPRGTMGSAEPVLSTGGDIDESMKRKVTAYITSKVEAYLDTNPRRAEVLRAMIDPNYELKIGETIIKPKGELLNLTAKKALATYGEPPTPLLANGAADDLTALLTAQFGLTATSASVIHLEVTWSETVAQWLNTVRPLLLGLGLLALYLEFKTPGFGIFGLSGIALLLLVFFGSSIAGLSGHEPLVLFGVGLLLLALEIFVLPGVGIFAALGLLAVAGSLVWAMADFWPQQPLDLSGFDTGVLVSPLASLAFGVIIAVALALALARFLPESTMFARMILSDASREPAQVAGLSATEAALTLPTLVGARGIAVTGLYPSGQIEIDGRRYEARLAVGSAAPGARVIVRRATDFALLVEVEPS